MRRHLRIRGDVQGVSFRYYSQRQAQTLGLKGWVRNAADGSVEAVVEGPAAAVQSFVEWAHTGPSSAVVRSVEVQDERPQAERDFRIVG